MEMIEDYLCDNPPEWTAELAFGASAKADNWGNKPVTLEQLKVALGSPATHAIGPKDGRAFLQGATLNGGRKAADIRDLSIIVLDIDGGTTLNEIREKVRARGLACAIYTTHSHSEEKHKLRAVFLLAKPWTAAMGEAHWKAAYRAFCAWLGVAHDPACEDVARLFYLPRHAAGAPFHAEWIDGMAVDIFSLPGAVPAKPREVRFRKAGTQNASADSLDGKLYRWAGAGYANAFLIADFIEALDPERLRPEYDREFKRHIECPFEHEHTKPGGGGTFVMNAGDSVNGSFVVNCLHGHCADRDRLDHLAGIMDVAGLGFDALCDRRWYLDIEGLDFSELEAIRDGKPIAHRDKVTGRAVFYDHHDWRANVDGVLKYLESANTPPKLFKFADKLSAVRRRDSGQIGIDEMDSTKLRHEVSRVCKWMKEGAKGTKEVAPPLEVCSDILVTPSDELPFPILDGLVGTPFFTKGGKLHSTPGYDPGSRIYYQPLPEFRMPPVPEVPSADEVARAKALLLDDVLCDFPFDGAAEKANAVAMILLPFVRNMIDGSTPLHWIDKPTPGTGASKLVNCVSLLSVGTPAETQTEVSSDDEWRKKITTSLMTGAPIWFVDNINKRLDSGALATAVTTPRWRDRLLGGNSMVEVPVRCTFIIAGNNIAMSSELLRRCVRIRLDAKMENPEKRTDFKHANLEKWITDHRGELVWACLALVQHWIAKGMPVWSGAPMGSFEEWSRTMGGILEAAGVVGFLANRAEVREKGDTDKVPVRLFLAAWYDTFREEPVSVGGKNADEGLYDLAVDMDPPLPKLTGDRSTRDKRMLGELLSAWKDQRYDVEPETGSMTVTVAQAGHDKKTKVALWRLKACEVLKSSGGK